ncbi:MAG: hypothetical protein NTW32_25095 [Chloroflexi bacterium]|nr:hypothetical protein [Chloroflexota bacterium]
MATPSPTEQIASEINSLQARIGWMQDSVRLKDTLNSMEDMQTSFNGMPQRIAALRAKGYVFEKGLEVQAGDFPRQWSTLQPALMAQINIQASALQVSFQSIEFKMTQLLGLRTNPAAARPLIASIQNEMEMLEDKVRSAESTVHGMFNSFDQLVFVLKKHLDEIEYMLTQLAEAKFTLLPSEAGLRAIKAVWCKDGKERDDDPEGVLYVTDQRLLFEQKEEVATKKILFITTEKKMVQELRWEIPVTLIDEVKPSKLGLLKNEDHLDIRYKEGAALENTHLHIWEDCNEWLQLLNRAKTKEFDKDRAVAIDQAEIDKVKTVPAQCPSCGANMDQVILRGQDSIKCAYCGFVIRL